MSIKMIVYRMLYVHGVQEYVHKVHVKVLHKMIVFNNQHVIGVILQTM